MDVLSRLEKALERAVEGAFARTFRARLHPIEIAKRLAREMDATKTVSVSTAYMPNRFRVGLSGQDYEEFEHVREAVLPEICAYLGEHARRARCTLMGEIEIAVESDEGLSAGEMRVESSMAVGGEPTAVVPPRRAEGRAAEGAVVTAQASLVAEDGAETPLHREVTRIGRAVDNDVVLSDQAVSRHHAEIRREDNGFVIIDMASKNGTYLNGERVERASLRDGDRIQMGSLMLVFRTS